MIAQNNTISPKNSRPLNYFALVKCMATVKDFCLSLSTNADGVEIHSPKFGSNLAGGNWTFISHLIEDIWYDYPTFVYSYPIKKI